MILHLAEVAGFTKNKCALRGMEWFAIRSYGMLGYLWLENA